VDFVLSKFIYYLIFILLLVNTKLFLCWDPYGPQLSIHVQFENSTEAKIESWKLKFQLKSYVFYLWLLNIYFGLYVKKENIRIS